MVMLVGYCDVWEKMFVVWLLGEFVVVVMFEFLVIKKLV